jgi:hypothetical protein
MLGNGSTNKHASTATKEYSNNGRGSGKCYTTMSIILNGARAIGKELQ